MLCDATFLSHFARLRIPNMSLVLIYDEKNSQKSQAQKMASYLFRYMVP